MYALSAEYAPVLHNHGMTIFYLNGFRRADSDAFVTIPTAGDLGINRVLHILLKLLFKQIDDTILIKSRILLAVDCDMRTCIALAKA